jgi:hypothetical protein
MFVTPYRLSQVTKYTNCVNESKDPWYATILSALTSSVPYLTETNTIITDKSIEFTVSGGIIDFFQEKKFIAVPVDSDKDEKKFKFKYYRNEKYLLKVINSNDDPDYSLYERCFYTGKVNKIENSVFCYGIHKVNDYYIEVYDNYMTLKEFEKELNDQEDKENTNVLSKILYSHKTYYYFKMAKFIDEINKAKERGKIRMNHIFFDKNGNIKFIPQKILLSISDQYSQVLFFNMWLIGNTDASKVYEKSNNEQPPSQIVMFMNNINSIGNKVTYDYIEQQYKLFPGDYDLGQISKDSGKWVK